MNLLNQNQYASFLLEIKQMKIRHIALVAKLAVY